jgi:hypothetical protein
MRAFPQLFAALASGEHERVYDAATLFGYGADESTLQSVRVWSEALPTAGLPRVPLTTKAMSREVRTPHENVLQYYYILHMLIFCCVTDIKLWWLCVQLAVCST